MSVSTFNVITTSKSLKELVSHYSEKPAFSFDVETVGDHRIDPVRNTISWVSMACDDRTDAIPLQHPNGVLKEITYPLLAMGEKRQAQGLPLRPQDYSKDVKKAVKHFGPPPTQLYPGEVFAALEPVYFADQIKIAHNAKFDVKSSAKYWKGRLPKGPFFDTMIGSWLIDPSRTGQLGLAACLKREFNHEMEKGIGAEVENYTFDEVAFYAAEDARWTFKLGQKLSKDLVEQGLWKLMRLEMDVLAAIAQMELTGAPIDMVALAELHEVLEADIEETTGRIYQLAGEPFNLNSTRAKVDLLFTPKKAGGRGLRPRLRTASGGPSVSAEALEKFRGKDELVDAMLEHADLNKLMSTYVIPYLGGKVTRQTNGKIKVVERESLLVNGRVHTDFVQNGAETGRFSSRNPNLQNIPNASTERGKQVRNLFCAADGEMLVCADYSQIEPRVIAHFTKDPILLSAYREGRDVYTAIADPLGLDRKAGKVAVLAMSYGVGPDKVESSLGLPAGSGKELLADFEKQFAAVYKYKRRVCAEAANRRPVPYVKTMFGRRRFLPDLRASEFGLKSRAERQAFNTLIQGSAADIMKIAIVRAHQMLPEEAKLLLTVHDELVTSCPEDMAEEVAEIIREAMEGFQPLDIPIKAGIDITKKWGDAEK